MRNEGIAFAMQMARPLPGLDDYAHVKWWFVSSRGRKYNVVSSIRDRNIDTQIKIIFLACVASIKRKESWVQKKTGKPEKRESLNYTDLAGLKAKLSLILNLIYSSLKQNIKSSNAKEMVKTRRTEKNNNRPN